MMPGRRWMILAVLFAARAATGFQFQSVGSAANMLMRDLELDYSEFGMLLGAYLLPGVIVAFPAARTMMPLTTSVRSVAPGVMTEPRRPKL